MAVLLNRTMNTMSDAVKCKAYLDDATVVGAMLDLHLALPLLKADLEAAGLTLNLAKCKLWRRGQDHAVDSSPSSSTCGAGAPTRCGDLWPSMRWRLRGSNDAGRRTFICGHMTAPKS